MNNRRSIIIAVFVILKCHTIEGATTVRPASNSTGDYWNTTGINVTSTPPSTESADFTEDATSHSSTSDEPQPSPPPCGGQVCDINFPCEEDEFIDNNDTCRVKCAAGQYGYRHECTCPDGSSVKFGICRNCTKDTDDPACHGPTDNKLIIIIAASVGGGVLLVIIIIVLVFVCRRRRRPETPGSSRRGSRASSGAHPPPPPPSIEEIDGNPRKQPTVHPTYENLNRIDKKLSEKIADGHEKIFRYVPDPVAAIKEKISASRHGAALLESPVSTAQVQLQSITKRPPAPVPYQDEAGEIYGNDEVIDRIVGRAPPSVPHGNVDQSEESSRASKIYVNSNELQKIMNAAKSGGTTPLAGTDRGYTNHAFREEDAGHGHHGDREGVKHNDDNDTDSIGSYENMATSGVMGYPNPVFSESAIDEPEYQNFSELKLNTLK